MKKLPDNYIEDMLHESFEHLSNEEQDSIFDEMYAEMLSKKESSDIKNDL